MATLVGNIRGPQGPQGTVGPEGPVGPTGPQGTVGPAEVWIGPTAPTDPAILLWYNPTAA